MRRLILGTRTRLTATAVVGLLPFLLSSCGSDTAPARGCSSSGPAPISLACFGDGRPDHGSHAQSCQASEYSYYNVHVQLLVSGSSPFYVDNATKLQIDSCTFKVTNEAGDVLEDRPLTDSSGIRVCRGGDTPYDMGILDYSSCCRAGTQTTFALVADSVDLSPLAQGTATVPCLPGQILPMIDLVVEKI